MILENVKRDIIQSSNEETIKMSISDEVMSHAVKILTEFSYEKPLESLIREQISNSLDSIQEACTKNPAILRLFKNDSGQWELNFIDDGLGLDKAEFEKYIMGLGESTKRDKPLSKGGFGGGAKVALSYTDTYNYICRKDGIERKFLVFKGEEFPESTMIYETKTTERNGVIVSVIVNNYDYHSCIKAIKEQCGYLSNVYFDVPGLDNLYNIIKDDSFQINNLYEYSELHISLLDIYYPINWSKLGIDKIHFPVALKFDDYSLLRPNYTRETIEWNKTSVQAIKNKITTVADYFVTLYNKSVKDSNNPMDLYKSMRDDTLNVTLNDKVYKINDLAKYSGITIVKPKLTGFSLLNVDELLGRTFSNDLILQEYEIVNKIDAGRWKTCSRHYDREITFSNLNRKVILVSDTVKGIKKEYLKEKYNGTGYYNSTLIVKKTKELPLGNKSSVNKNNYYNLLQLFAYHKTNWRILIKEFQQFVKLITNSWIDGDKIEVPQEFIDARKKVKSSVSYTPVSRKIKLSGEITIKKAEKLQRYVGGKNCKWTNYNWDLAKICKHKSLIVYGQEKDVRMMDKLFDVLNKYSMKTKITLLQITDREMKIVKDLNIHNLISFDKFMEGKNKPFKRLVTAYLINQLEEKHEEAFIKHNQITQISTELGNSIRELKVYGNQHYNSGNKEMWNALLAVAEEHNLWDETIYSTYKEVKAILDKFSFINNLIKFNKENCVALSPILQSIRDLCKYHKFKINSEHYVPVITEPIEELTEETILETI